MAGTSADELAARFGDRYDADVGASMVARSSGHMPGIPEFLGLAITEVGPGWLTCELDVRPDLLNPVGVAHGAVVASLIDHVLGATVIPLMAAGSWPATLEFKVNYMAPAREGRAPSQGRSALDLEAHGCGRGGVHQQRPNGRSRARHHRHHAAQRIVAVIAQGAVSPESMPGIANTSIVPSLVEVRASDA